MHLFAALLPLLVSLTAAHRPILDDGTHTSISAAYQFPDAQYARRYMVSFECPSSIVYTQVYLNETDSPQRIELEIPDIPALKDFRPTLWIAGKTLNVPDDYENQTANQRSGLPLHDESFLPIIPRDLTALEYASAASGTFKQGGSESAGVLFHTVVAVNVSVSAPGNVYFIVQPTEHRLGRAVVAFGVDETEGSEMGEISAQDRAEWYQAKIWPTIGKKCVRW